MAEYVWDSKTNSAADKLAKNSTSRLWVQHLGACTVFGYTDIYSTSRTVEFILLPNQLEKIFCLIPFLTACLFAFSVGNSLGWTSPAGPYFLKGTVGFKINEKENSLVGSLLTIGAAVSCLPAGYVMDKIGRKMTLLCLVPISLLGWGLIICANSVDMLYAGRFLLGIITGTVCVTVPVYSAEICHKKIRGTVGSYFQLLLAGGILFVYVIGSQFRIFWFSLICGLIPVIFGVAFIFFPETPVYYLTKGRREEARKSLKFFRGENVFLDFELHELSEYSDQEILLEESVLEVLLSRPGIKSLLMSVAVMMFQQFSGINAFIFNATEIFEHAGSALDARFETIIIGLMQVVGTLFATFLVDYLGRIVLLGTSALFMSVCTFFLGLYFYLLENHFDISVFSFIPLLSLCAFVIMFSIGYGAVPWLLMSELIPSRIKGVGTSVACVINWLSAFIVTEFFFDLANIFGKGVNYWIFSVISALAAVFSYKVLPETKGQSFDEIQRQLGGVIN